MTEMQKKMQELISQEELDRAFDARFPKEMQVKLRAAKVAVAASVDWGQISQLCLQEAASDICFWWISMWWM